MTREPQKLLLSPLPFIILPIIDLGFSCDSIIGEKGGERLKHINLSTIPKQGAKTQALRK